jgi:hypothetical protein
MGERSRQAGKLIVCAGIVTAAAVTLGLSVHHDLQTTAAALKPASVKQQTALLRQEECLYQAIRAEVPKGAPVYVTSPTFQPTQRLAELSTLWAVPQASLAASRWRLSLVPAHGHSITRFTVTGNHFDPAHGQCGGITLEVRRR